jgi:phosphate-selective porin OprO and OprP
MSHPSLHGAAPILAASLLALHGAAVTAQPATQEQIEKLNERIRMLDRKTARPVTQEQIEDLNQEILILDRKLEIEQEEQVEAEEEDAVLSASYEGFAIESADEFFELKIRALLQADGRYFLDDEDVVDDTYLLRRARAIFEGSVGPYIGFRLMPDFAGDETTLFDAYVDVGVDPATLRAGKFKAPVGLERLQSAPYLHFAERAYPTELAPNRDIGGQFLGSVSDERLTYALAVTNGTPDGQNSPATNPDDNFELSARLFGEPLEGLGIGVAGTIGDKEGGFGEEDAVDFLPRYRSPGQNTIFEYAETTGADGEHLRWTPQAYYYYGPFGLMAEYIQSELEVTNGTVTDSLQHEATQVTAAYVLTGESASYEGIIPDAPLGGGGLGELELVGRYTTLDLDEQTFPLFADPATSVSEAETFGVGLNWYLTANIKAVLDYFLTSFEAGAEVGDRPDEHAVLSRLQLFF